MKSENILEVTALRIRYGDFEAVKGVSFALKKGGILGIVGESGSGKSTIARALVGLVAPSSGMIRIGTASDDSTIRRFGNPKNSLQMVFQDAVGSLNPRMTVRSMLEEVIAHYPDAGVKIPTLLAQVGLSEAVLEQYPREMSGGQCQRVSVARALATGSKILIADEPVSALDVSVQARVLNLLRDLRRDFGLSILLIAHDLAVVRNVCDEVCVMERGRFVDVGTSDEVFSSPKSDYTRRLLKAVPRI